METQEKIKDRILRRAAQVWGYTDSDLASNFDPVVSLLLEACGSELEKISTKIDDSRARVTERMLEIMSPEDKGIISSHSILHLTPVENNYVLSVKDQFQCKKTIPNLYDPLQNQTKDIYFGTTLPFVLTSAKLSYTAFGNSLYSLQKTIYKDIMFKGSKHLESGNLWLGIQCPKDITSIQKLMFFTEVKNLSQREFFYNYLKQAKFSIGGQEIPFKKGYNTDTYTLDINAIINQNYSKINQLYREANEYYLEQFIHFTQDIEIEESLFEIPEELKAVFKADKLKELSDVIWIKVEFPEVVIAEVLENVRFSINSIPVINKKLITLFRSIDPYINYIPLETEDTFLDLDEIRDSQGSLYHIKNFEEGNLGVGNASLRQTGIARFDYRNASELIQYLLEALKDESAAFSHVEESFVHQSIIKANQIISALEEHIKKHQFVRSEYPYVIIRPKIAVSDTEENSFLLSYWTGNGEDANNLKTGTQMSSSYNNFQENSIMLIMNSVGGKSRLSSREKITSYREALLGKGRVVTFADIKNFSLNHFGESITSVEIEKGTKIDSSLSKGFVRTIDITIEKYKDTDLDDFGWQFLCDSLLHKLNRVSSNVYPYRLLIKEESGKQKIHNYKSNKKLK